jgi:hypothetical protein
VIDDSCFEYRLVELLDILSRARWIDVHATFCEQRSNACAVPFVETSCLRRANLFKLLLEAFVAQSVCLPNVDSRKIGAIVSGVSIIIVEKASKPGDNLMRGLLGGRTPQKSR